MSVMLDTTLGEIVIDLDLEGSENLCRNFLKLVKVQYYTNTVVYSVQHNRCCKMGDPRGDGTGGCSIYGLIDASLRKLDDAVSSPRRFLSDHVNAKQLTPQERRRKGVVAMINTGGVEDTIGSQFLITLDAGEGAALDGMQLQALSLGVVAEDEENVLDKINALSCNQSGRPCTDVRIKKALIVDDPFPDPKDMDVVLMGPKDDALNRGSLVAPRLVKEKSVKPRICANGTGPGDELARLKATIREKKRQLEEQKRQHEEQKRRLEEQKRRKELRQAEASSASNSASSAPASATSSQPLSSAVPPQPSQKDSRTRAHVFETPGNISNTEAKAKETMLFVCNLNPVIDEEDLAHIFSRFDTSARACVIRDEDTGESLLYAFVDFATKEQCNEAYAKMNNILVKDRRIRVDLAQNVSNEWNRFTAQQNRENGSCGTDVQAAASNPSDIHPFVNGPLSESQLQASVAGGPPCVLLQPPPRISRGNGRGTDNRPAWMVQRERQNESRVREEIPDGIRPSAPLPGWTERSAMKGRGVANQPSGMTKHDRQAIGIDDRRQAKKSKQPTEQGADSRPAWLEARGKENLQRPPIQCQAERQHQLNGRIRRDACPEWVQTEEAMGSVAVPCENDGRPLWMKQEEQRFAKRPQTLKGSRHQHVTRFGIQKASFSAPTVAWHASSTSSGTRGNAEAHTRQNRLAANDMSEKRRCVRQGVPPTNISSPSSPNAQSLTVPNGAPRSLPLTSQTTRPTNARGVDNRPAWMTKGGLRSGPDGPGELDMHMRPTGQGPNDRPAGLLERARHSREIPFPQGHGHRLDQSHEQIKRDERPRWVQTEEALKAAKQPHSQQGRGPKEDGVTRFGMKKARFSARGDC